MPAQIQIIENAVTLVNGGTVAYTAANQGDAAEIKTFAVSNQGDSKLTIVQGPLGSGFKAINKVPSEIFPGESFNLTVRTNTTTPGEFSRTLKFSTNDPNASQFLVTLTVSIANTGLVVYSSRTNLNRRFGKENIRIWSDLDGSEDENSIEEVAYQALYDASRVVDAFLSGGVYDVPFADPPPDVVEQITCMKAGCNLYTARAMFVKELDMRSSRIQAQSDHLLSSIRNGTIQLDNITKDTDVTYMFVE